MDREAWQATVHGFAKSRTQLSMLEALSRSLQSMVTQTVKNLLAMQETLVQSLVWEDALEKKMATNSSILAHGQRSLAGYTVHGVAKSWT